MLPSLDKIQELRNFLFWELYGTNLNSVNGFKIHVFNMTDTQPATDGNCECFNMKET